MARDRRWLSDDPIAPSWQRADVGRERPLPWAADEDDPVRPRNARRWEQDWDRAQPYADSSYESRERHEPVEKFAPATSGGAGGRVLAIAAILFLGLSVVFASAGGFLSGSNGRATKEPARATERATSISAGATSLDGNQPVPTPDNTDNQEQIPTSEQTAEVAFSDDQVADAAPIARQMGFPGSWLDGVQTVCIDPGHGGSDRGRIREADALFPRLEEAEFTLIQGLALRDRLEARGYVVVMTRTSDTDVNAEFADVNGDGKTKADSERDGIFDEMQARINVCNRANADLMVSIHINGYDTERPNGYETWYTFDREFGEQSRRIAELTHEALGEQIAVAGYVPEARGVKDDGSVSVDDSDPTLENHMLITGPELPGRLRPSQMPGVIVEGLFITNPDDAAFLVSDGGLAAIVAGYEEAIAAYFNEYEF